MRALNGIEAVLDTAREILRNNKKNDFQGGGSAMSNMLLILAPAVLVLAIFAFFYIVKK